MNVKMTVPNMLTLMRILFIPLFVVLFYLPWTFAKWTTLVLYVTAAVTDWLDGYLARKLGQSSKFGAFLDPVADKLMISVALVLLVAEHGNGWLAIPAAIIIGREITISALREWMAEIGRRQEVAVGRLGKYKTAVQMIAVCVLLANHPFQVGSHWIFLGYLLLYAAVLLTLWSMTQYLRAALSLLTLKEDPIECTTQSSRE